MASAAAEEEEVYPDATVRTMYRDDEERADDYDDYVYCTHCNAQFTDPAELRKHLLDETLPCYSKKALNCHLIDFYDGAMSYDDAWRLFKKRMELPEEGDHPDYLGNTLKMAKQRLKEFPWAGFIAHSMLIKMYKTRVEERRVWNCTVVYTTQTDDITNTKHYKFMPDDWLDDPHMHEHKFWANRSVATILKHHPKLERTFHNLSYATLKAAVAHTRRTRFPKQREVLDAIDALENTLDEGAYEFLTDHPAFDDHFGTCTSASILYVAMGLLHKQHHTAGGMTSLIVSDKNILERLRVSIGFRGKRHLTPEQHRANKARKEKYMAEILARDIARTAPGAPKKPAKPAPKKRHRKILMPERRTRPRRRPEVNKYSTAPWKEYI